MFTNLLINIGYVNVQFWVEMSLATCPQAALKETRPNIPSTGLFVRKNMKLDKQVIGDAEGFYSNKQAREQYRLGG